MHEQAVHGVFDVGAAPHERVQPLLRQQLAPVSVAQGCRPPHAGCRLHVKLLEHLQRRLQRH